MALKIYTTQDRLVGEVFVRGSVEVPTEVQFPDPEAVVFVTKKVPVTRPEKRTVKGFDRKANREVDVEIEVPVEVVIEQKVRRTDLELRAMGLIVRDEKDGPPDGEKLKPPFSASGAVAGAMPSHTRDKVPEGRPSDKDPGKK